ncbi:heparan-alpha-glucosaminide N-acetyltransferase domain-containing protein [Deinococcus multiflagellatus]|uniref:Heparan-alpha-glucosaminide N-acetyltransferase domain-containing protein n=1 Tax=Deinococcus multiflagellatus TaxID=1656887 RepID=A0ABW1ZGU1_9DEIO
MAAPTLPTGSVPSSALASSAGRVTPASGRLTALDAFRGLTVMLMLLVNNVALGSATPAQLQHAPFGGLTLTDLVFPWFLLCAGAALPFSLAAMTRAGLTGGARLRRVLERAALLYLLGAFVSSVTAHRLTLGLGVLQLIALATLCGALLAPCARAPRRWWRCCCWRCTPRS